jgi:hypothetical protein
MIKEPNEKYIFRFKNDGSKATLISPMRDTPSVLLNEIKEVKMFKDEISLYEFRNKEKEFTTEVQ